jgi:hypothetical protein
MAIAYRAKYSAQTAGGSASLVLTKPAGTVDGDVMLVFLGMGDDLRVFSAPGGWTELHQANDADSHCRIACFYKVASSEGADYTFTTTSAPEWTGSISSFSGVDNSTPISASAIASDNTGGSREASPTYSNTITPATLSMLIMGICGNTRPTGGQTVDASSQAIVTDDPGGWTEISQDSNTNAFVMHGLDVSRSAIRTATSATGNSSATLSNAAYSICIIVALKRAAESLTATLTDTTTVTDAVTSTRDMSVSLSDTVSSTDILDTDKNEWSNTDKSSTSWVNQTKS